MKNDILKAVEVMKKRRSHTVGKRNWKAEIAEIKARREREIEFLCEEYGYDEEDLEENWMPARYDSACRP